MSAIIGSMISQLVSTLQTLWCLLIMLSGLTPLTTTTFSSSTSAGIVFQCTVYTCAGTTRFRDVHFNLHCLHDSCLLLFTFQPLSVFEIEVTLSAISQSLHSALNTISSFQQCPSNLYFRYLDFYGHISNFQLFQDFNYVKCFSGKIAAETACRFCLENATAHLTIVGKKT